MNRSFTGFLALLLLAGCGQDSAEPSASASSEAPAETQDTSSAMEEKTMMEQPSAAQVELVPGLKSTTTTEGAGAVAAAGQNVEVHYTGWLYDPDADGGRGTKFDSSVDRGQTFSFPLGAGRVIQGWDKGVAGMKIGETRELLISPEMGYGDRGAGSVIPPGATLLFEVELISVQ
ncbi:MAG: FKBP-type peptidyl-prolyl cis-trans isomerase [Pseudomonadota bacterium]